MCIFGGVNNPTAPEDGTAPGGAGDMTTTMRDCGNLLRCCVQADLSRLPSREPKPRQPHLLFANSCATPGSRPSLVTPLGLSFVPLTAALIAGHEVFFGKAPVPSDVHGYGKAEALLGYEPLDTLASFFAKL